MKKLYLEFASGLVHMGAIKFGDFILKSGAKSPFYIDLRLLRSSPEMLRAGAGILSDLTIQGPSFERIADVPTAATPLVTAMVVLHNLQMITPREAKGHGTKVTIEGHYLPGMKVRLIDDLITKATSKLESIKILREAGLIVEEVCVIIDREQGGKEELAKAGVNLRAAFTAREFMVHCYVAGVVPPQQRDEIMAYLDSQAVPS